MLRDSNNPRYINHLAQYAFDFGYHRSSIYISDNERAFAICYWKGKEKYNWFDYFLQCKLFITALSVRRIFKILKHTITLSAQHPKHKPFLYFWFYGALSEAKQGQSARELAYGLLKIAREQKSDIYTETTMEQNRRVYERFGFEVYHESYNKDGDFPVWFMRWKGSGNSCSS